MIKMVFISIFACWQVAHWGGTLNNGANAGLFYSNFNNGATNRNANIGAQLSCFMPDMITTALAEKNKIQSEINNYYTFS